MKEIRLLIVHNYYRKRYRGGEDIVFEREYEALSKEQSVETFKYTCSNDDVHLSLHNTFFSLEHYRNVRKIIRNNNINIVHIHNLFIALTPSVIRAARDCGCRIVQTVHNYRWFCPNGVIYNPQLNAECRKCFGSVLPYYSIRYKCNYNDYFKSFYIAAINTYSNISGITDMIDRFIVMTNDSCDVLMDAGIDKERIAVKPHFIEAPFERKSRRTGRFIYIGRVDRLKGIDMLVEAAKRAGIVLHIVGEGPDSEKVKNICIGSSNIHFEGIVAPQRIFDHIYGADFLIMPSLMRETFGLTIIESMSAGVPVIGSAIGSRIELIDNSRGILYAPDLNELESALHAASRMNDTDYDIMSSNAFDYAQQFRREKNIPILLNIYRGLL